MIKDISEHMPKVLQLVQRRGFKVFQDGDYDMNIVAIRRLKDRTNNAFDDVIHFVYRKDGVWVDEYCSCTTDPGTYWLTKKDYRKDGVAILVHDQQARGAYKIGTHKGYEALEQVQNVSIWRDNNFDDTADYACSEVHKGVFKCNIHKAGTDSTQVNKWSAGCIVIAKRNDYLRVMHLAKKQVLSLGYKTFTLTLLGCDYGSLDN
jgi:hypothetical protein